MFHAAHQARFGFGIPGEIIEIVNFTATVVSCTTKPKFRHVPVGGTSPPPRGHRPVRYVDAMHDTAIYRRDDLKAGQSIFGPAVIEEAASVTVLNPAQRLTVDPYGHLLLQTVYAN
jgi:N-methylhydantoinase A